MNGKCPKCEKLLTNVKVVATSVNTEGSKVWKGAAFICPFCYTILSVGIDPHALKTETVAEVIDAIRRG